MATNTAGNTGYKNSDFNGPFILKKKVVYSEWSGTNNDAHSAGFLPPFSTVIAAFSHVIVKTAFNDTNHALNIGITGGDADWFASALDFGTGSGVLLTLDDLTNTERYSASVREVVYNWNVAPAGNGTTGEAYIYIGYLMAGP
jgi:hypothetical protein